MFVHLIYFSFPWFQKPEDTCGFYKTAYSGQYHEYYTDRYYMAVGNVDKEQGEEVRDAPVNQSCGGSNPC